MLHPSVPILCFLLHVKNNALDFYWFFPPDIYLANWIQEVEYCTSFEEMEVPI